jgi:hypothetical protein
MNDEYSYVAAQVFHSSLIIFLLSHVLLRMSIRSTLKGDSFSSARTWRKYSFVTEIIQHVEWHAWLKSLKTPPHTGETCLRQQSQVTLSSADSSCVRRASRVILIPCNLIQTKTKLILTYCLAV